MRALLAWHLDEQAVYSAAVGEKADEMLVGGEDAVPPAALLPTFAGEPEGADWAWPVDPRGCGDVWPGASRLRHGQRAARYPIAYAWAMLRRDASWTYRDDEFNATMRGEQAIATVLEGLMGAADASRLAVLVVPAEVQGERLSVLAGALERRVGRCEFVSRPVAAAGALMSRAPFGARPAGEGITVLTLHLGLTQWEAGLVRIREAGQGEVVMELLETNFPDAPGSYGLDLVGRLAARSLEMSYRQATPTRLWELVWCTPWLRIVLDLLSGARSEAGAARPALSAHAMSVEFLRQQWRQATQQILSGAPGAAGFLVQDLPGSPRQEDLRDWVSALRERAARENVAAVVVTGAMAGVVDRELGAFGEYYAKRIVPQVKAVVLEGRELPRGCLAVGAAAVCS